MLCVLKLVFIINLLFEYLKKILVVKVFETIKELKIHLDNNKQKGKSIGFVPTMGALHSGHTSLIEIASLENDIVVCSIFINPKQFDNKEDLQKYPRDLNKDLDILKKLNCNTVFIPSEEEMYPEPVTKQYAFGGLEKVMEGKYRKDHFNGVAIVVKRLFDIVNPNRAYFGIKDYQQLLIVKQLVQKSDLTVEIIPCETVREPDGLAMSSRNKRLTKQQRAEATTIYKTLVKASKIWKSKSIKELKEMVTQKINAKPTLKLEYFEIVNPENLKPINNIMAAEKAIACIAVFAGNTRLIDNIFCD